QAFAAPRAAETAAPVEAPAPQAEEIAPQAVQPAAPVQAQASVAPVVEPAPQAAPAAPQAETTAPSAPAQSPVIEPAAPVAATPDVPTPAEPAAPAQRQMRVLAAEDNRTNRLIFSKLVKACDIDLQFATDGSEAVAAYEEQMPDLIFMDISMPGVDGTEATRRIRAIEAERGLPRARIVALTAHAMEGDAEKILRHGLDRHLTKPLKKAEIFAELEGAKPADALPPLPQE
ncbi:MAG: response regulator, partial [Maritimibacter sp.]